MNELLDKLSDISNRSLRQTEFLYDLLNKDFKKLVLLEQKIKNNHLSYCPGSKEDCEEVLVMGDGFGWVFGNERYSHLDDFLNKEDKLQKECTYKSTGHRGKIINELSWTKRFPAQWGVFWYDGRHGDEHAERNITISLLNYWQDKNLIHFER